MITYLGPGQHRLDDEVRSDPDRAPRVEHIGVGSDAQHGIRVPDSGRIHHLGVEPLQLVAITLPSVDDAGPKSR